MGATTFSNTITANTATAGYAALVERARQEHGNGGYTGTIAETRGFKLVTLRAGETIDACEERVIEAAVADNAPGSKWGAAACLDLGPTPASPGQRRFVFFGWASC